MAQEAVRDGNQVTAKLGSFNGSPTRLKVDHPTGYLKAKITITTLSVPSVDIERAKHDDNNVASCLGSYNGTPKPLLVDHATGALRAVNV